MEALATVRAHDRFRAVVTLDDDAGNDVRYCDTGRGEQAGTWTVPTTTAVLRGCRRGSTLQHASDSGLKRYTAPFEHVHARQVGVSASAYILALRFTQCIILHDLSNM